MLVINPSMQRFPQSRHVMTVLLEMICDLKECFKNLGYVLLTGIAKLFSSCTSAIVHERGDQPYDTSIAGTSEGKRQFENPW